MNPKLRVVTHHPHTELWRDDGFVTTQRGDWLSAEDVRSLLQSGPLRFVVSKGGMALDWILPGRCFDFWKSEVKPHLAPREMVAPLEDFPGEYCYFASRWGGDAVPIVLLEAHH